MALYIDKQTLDDLVIFAKRGKDSVFQIFNKTHTSGGAELLEEWFRYPLSDAQKIRQRSELIRLLVTENIDFPFQSIWFDQCLYYLDMADERTRLDTNGSKIGRKFQSLIGADHELQKIIVGIKASTQIIHALKQFIASPLAKNKWFAEALQRVNRKLQESRLSALPLLNEQAKADYEEIVSLDNILRFQEKGNLSDLLREIYALDVYLTAARVARERHFCFADIDTSPQEKLSYQGVFHPLLPDARGNDLNLNTEHNIVFLTGANMAGKSTFMKSLGIALYLAHMGFPVPAQSLVFSIKDAIYTSINLPDNVHMGYSHFYAEVLRIKTVAQQLTDGKKLFVIFDEMFRGTNVKDAYEATVEIVSRLYHNPLCQFIISTHIIEAGEALESKCPKINFVYLPSQLVNGIPHYTYQLRTGVTADRHGMIIVQNEQILDMLNHSIENPSCVS